MLEEAERKIDELRLIEDKNDILSVLDRESSRRFLWRLLCYCGIYRDPDGTPEEIMKQLGKRQVGLYLLHILTDADDEKVFDMMREAKLRDKEEIYERERIRKELERDDDADDGDGDDYTDYGSGLI